MSLGREEFADRLQRAAKGGERGAGRVARVSHPPTLAPNLGRAPDSGFGLGLADSSVRLEGLVVRRFGAFSALPRIGGMRDRRSVEKLGDVVNEALARVLRRSVGRGIHPDRVLGTGFDAQTPDDATHLIAHETGGKFLAPPPPPQWL